MSTTVYQYRLYCNDCVEYKFVWGAEEPTSCPINAEHSIDSDSITVIETVNRAQPEDLDGRRVFHCTPRHLGTFTYFSSTDDDHTDPHAVGGSSNVNSLMWNHEVDGPNPETIYLDYNTIYNQTWIRQGDIMWENALQDTLSFSIVPKITQCSEGSNTSYDLYGGYLIVPNPYSTGSIVVENSDRILVQNVSNEFGDMPVGYWDADWDIENKQFINITPNYYGTGGYNMFAAEVVLHRFMHRRRLMGTGRKDCVTEDIAQLGHNMRIRIEAYTEGSDHAWSGCGTMMMYRQKTC